MVLSEGLLTGGAKVTSVIAARVDTVELSLNILNTCGGKDETVLEGVSEVQKWVEFRDQVRQDHKAKWSMLDPEKGWTRFYVSGSSANGYPVKLHGNGWELLTGKMAVVGGRPNTRIQLHSELLWLYGYEVIACGIIEALKGLGLVVDQVRLSRVDLMADVLVERGKVSEEWTKRVNGSARVVRSFWSESDGEYTGFETAPGWVKLRVYDKFDEIRSNSSKDFSYVFNQWGISEEPENMNVYRVEFEMRRNFLRTWGINEPGDLVGKESGLWCYLTDEWARVTDGAVREGKNKKREKIDETWRVVQGAYGERGDLARLRREKVGKKSGYMWEDPSMRPGVKNIAKYIAFDRFMRGADPKSPIDIHLIMKRFEFDLMMFCGGHKELQEEMSKGVEEFYEEFVRKGIIR